MLFNPLNILQGRFLPHTHTCTPRDGIRSSAYKALAAILIAAAGCCTASAGEFAGSVSLLSNYKQGGSDTNFFKDKYITPTLQGNLFYKFDNGWYVGHWGSTIKTFENNRFEGLGYVGYKGKLGPGLVDVSVGYDYFPGASQGNSAFLFVFYQVGVVTFKSVTTLSNTYYGFSDARGRQVVALETKKPITDRLILKGEIGRVFVTDGMKAQRVKDKSYYAIGGEYLLDDGFSITAFYSGADTVPGPNFGYRNKARLIFGVKKQF